MSYSLIVAALRFVMDRALFSTLALVLAFAYFKLKTPAGDNAEKESEEVDVGAAELQGKTWPQLSVFEHVELGLKKNPHEPAVICLAKQSQTVHELVALCAEEQPQPQLQLDNLTRSLWCKNESPSSSPPSTPAPEKTPIGFTLTYAQLHRQGLQLAKGLLAAGVRPNTRMVMLIPNGAEYAILLWACILLRITYVNMDPSSLDIAGYTALKHQLQVIKPQLVVVPDAVSGKAIDVAMAELGLPHPVRVCLSAPSSIWKGIVSVASSSDAKSVIDDATLEADARRDDPSRINSIMFTSGTSGLPKGCPQTVAAISHALHSQTWLIDSDSGAAKCALMQPHNSRGIAPAQTLQTWRAGGALVLTGQTFSVSDALTAISHLSASFLVLTPPMVSEFATALSTSPLDISCVKRIQIGGDAVTKQCLVKCASLFPKAQVCVNHGMTEGPGVFTWPFLDTPVEFIPFVGGQICPVGVVAAGATIRLSSTVKQGVPVKRGELGELHILCPSIIRGYTEGRSGEQFYEDGKGRWFNTGDMAMMDGQGLVFILGRKKDMIRRGGVTIAPAVIESCVAAFTQCQAVVVPVPHAVLGSEPYAVVDSFENSSAEQVKEHIRVELGKDYALGEVVSLKQLGFSEFPVNATHKIIKSDVQDAVLKYLRRTATTTV